MEPAATLVFNHFLSVIKQGEYESAIRAQDGRPAQLKELDNVQLAFIDDDRHDPRTSLDATGRALEVDVMINVAGTDDGEQLAHCLEIAAAIESVAGQDEGRHAIGGAYYVAERVRDELVSMDGDKQSPQAMLVMQYSLLYRVRRGAPSVLI